jgi:kynurenine formamidase
MCAPGTIETVRQRFEQEEGLVRFDRRTALLAGAGAAVAATLPGGARAARTRGGRHAQDLTHVFRVGFPMFVGAPPPERKTHVTIPVNGFYGQIWTIWEHTATHLDVPAHFVLGGRTTPQLTLDELIAPIAVIDISERAASNPDTVVTPDDVRTYERRHGRIKRGSIVAMNSGWESRVGSEAAYRNIGSDGLQHFPGFASTRSRSCSTAALRRSASTRSASTPATRRPSGRTSSGSEPTSSGWRTSRTSARSRPGARRRSSA